MKKKITILALTLLFFVSTTGLPIIIHHCEMMETASLEVCEMHKKEVKEACCGEENQAEAYITSGYDSCCSSKLVDPSVKDNFVSSKTEFQNKTELLPLLIVSTDFYLSSISLNNFYNDTSPPPLIDNNLYLFNSVLLI